MWESDADTSRGVLSNLQQWDVVSDLRMSASYNEGVFAYTYLDFKKCV